MELMDPDFYHAFSPADPPWPSTCSIPYPSRRLISCGTILESMTNRTRSAYLLVFIIAQWSIHSCLGAGTDAVCAAFAHADPQYTEVMPVSELELPPNEYFSGFQQRIGKVRRRVARVLEEQHGGRAITATLRVLIVAHSPHIPCWFFEDLIGNAFGEQEEGSNPHSGYCSIANIEQGPSRRGGVRVTMSTGASSSAVVMAIYLSGAPLPAALIAS